MKILLPAYCGWLLYHQLEDVGAPPVLGAFVDPAVPDGTYEVVETARERDATKLRFVDGTHGKNELEEGGIKITHGPYRGAAAAKSGWTDSADLRVYGIPVCGRAGCRGLARKTHGQECEK